MQIGNVKHMPLPCKLTSEDLNYILQRYNIMYWNVYGADIMREMKNEELRLNNKH